MKTTELKIGDYFLFKENLVRVCSVDDEVCVTANGEYIGARVGDLSPAPLTKEILEKNGWQWDEYDRLFFYESCPNVCLIPSGKGFNVVDATGEQFGRINAAVHELQHLLWALGIDDDLKI